MEDIDTILLIKTIQIPAIRTLIVALKDILIEANIEFQKDGIKIISMDKSFTVLVHLHLHAEKFERYDCDFNKIIVGVNMNQLYKIFGAMENNDTLTIYIDKEDYCDGVVSHLGLKFENASIGKCVTQKLKLIEPDNEELSVPEVEFSSIINLPSADFQKMIRDLSQLSEKLVITSMSNELVFECSGSFASSNIRLTEANGSTEFTKKPDESKIIKEAFSLKNLSYFIRCTSLCPQIEMYLENDKPLVVKYYVASLGEVKLCLSPLPKETKL